MLLLSFGRPGPRTEPARIQATPSILGAL